MQQNSAQIIQQHYGLKHPITEAEVHAEIANLMRRGNGNLDDRQQALAAKLDLFK